MSHGPGSNDRLHLADLSVKGFRGIGALEIPRLGRVTLLAGKNAVGKTTVLEACRVYAVRGRYSALSELANRHEEYSATAVALPAAHMWTPGITELPPMCTTFGQNAPKEFMRYGHKVSAIDCASGGGTALATCRC